MYNVSFKTDHIMQFFVYKHLAAHLQAVSKPFCDLARDSAGDHPGEASYVTQFPLPRNPEREVTLRKLLEAKDAAARALVANRI